MPSGPPPGEYTPMFHFIEHNILMFCDEFGDKSDQEFEKIFNDLRRCPDGASRDDLHAYIWHRSHLPQLRKRSAKLLAETFQTGARRGSRGKMQPSNSVSFIISRSNQVQDCSAIFASFACRRYLDPQANIFQPRRIRRMPGAFLQMSFPQPQMAWMWNSSIRTPERSAICFRFAGP